MILIGQLFMAIALLTIFLSLDRPLSKALRADLAARLDGLFSRRTLRVLIALVAMALVAAAASGQPWLVGVLGVSDVTLFLDVALISLVLGSIGLARSAVEHLVRLRPWRRGARSDRSRPRRRRLPASPRPRADRGDEDEPAPAFAWAFAA